MEQLQIITFGKSTINKNKNNNNKNKNKQGDRDDAQEITAF